MQNQRLRLNRGTAMKTEAILADHQDMQHARETYSLFNKLLKWGTIVTVLTTILVVAIIAGRAA
jgi:hypothetical protein